MKICVTGASGFIGRNLTSHLISNGHSVVAQVRTHPDSVDTSENKNCEYRVGDIRDKQSLSSVFDGCDVVIHLAALFNSPESSLEEYRDTNITGTQNVLEVAHATGVGRVVHCSTVGVASGGKPPYSESAPYAPPEWDKYETTKAEAEKLAIDYHASTDFPVVVIRPAQVYGPGDLGKIKFYKMIKKGIIVRQGATLKHLIYIDDLCRAFELACSSSEGFGTPMIIASPEPTRLSELVKIGAKELGTDVPKINIPATPVTLLATVVEIVFNALGKKPPIFRRSMNFFTKSVAFNAENAERYLQFSSQVSTETGVRNTVSWYRDNGYI